jgi:flagellar motor protein MotB
MKRTVLLLAALIFMGNGFIAAEAPKSPPGADAVPDLFAPNLAGPGGFSTTTGGAPASALNPAQGGSARRIVFDVGYLAIPVFPSMGKEEPDGYMQSIEAGAMFPTRYGVFGGSLRYIGGFDKDQFVYFPINPTFGGNFFGAKEVYPGMSVGLGLNFGFGADWTASADLGFHYDTGGNLGPFKNFTWAFVLRSMGKSYFPTWLTPMGGIAFDLLRVEGKDGKADPFAIGFAADLGFPSLFSFRDINMIFKAGLDMTIAEIVTVSLSWPGGSGLNMRELAEKNVAFPVRPSIGLGINLRLPSGGQRIAGGRLPSDGDLRVDGGFKPLYEGVTALGGGVTWFVGMADKKPPVIAVDYPETMYFSPNHDGNADYLEFPIKITDDHYVTSWVMEIKDKEGKTIRSIRNKELLPTSFNMKDFFIRLAAVKKQVEVPPVLMWDGILDDGSAAPDGRYFFTITSTDDSDNVAISPVYEAVLKNTPPQISLPEIPGAQRIFNPMGGERDTITFRPYVSEEDPWESGIWNAAGEKIRSFAPVSGSPAVQVWDGKNDAGAIAPDGVYSYRISATDRALNSASATMNNIILDGRVAGIFLTSSASRIAPKAGQSVDPVVLDIHLSFKDGVESWKVELKDESGAARRTFSGTAAVPANLQWNGLNDQGAVVEGIFTPELTVRYTRGDEVKTTATTVLVDVSGPELSFAGTPEFFSPDNDGVEDELYISLSAQDASPIDGWTLEIYDHDSGTVFYHVEGKGNPTPRLIWNGRSNRGEVVQSATDYPYTFSAVDILGNANSIDGIIEVDVLVIRDGDVLRIQIPSIVFRPNYADFVGLSQDVVDNNNRILRRIAQILNKFRDYKVNVEGHANPTTAPNTPARTREETELQSISENRAKRVVDELVRNGVARNRLTAIGVGGTRTVVPYDDADNRWKNRRVEFILVK